MASSLRFLLVVAYVLGATAFTISAEPKSGELETRHLRFFNTAIFGKTTAEPVVLLKPALSGQLDPETVMVDIDKGRYFAATVRYPRRISFADARRSLNTIYAKHEIKSFADDPIMGLWRNEEEKFAIQLTEEKDNLVVIYIKFSLVTEDKFFESFSRAIRELESDEKEP